MDSQSHGIRLASLESTAVNYSVAVLYTGPVAALQVQELVASAVFAGTWRSRNTVMNVKLELLCAISGRYFSFQPPPPTCFEFSFAANLRALLVWSVAFRAGC